METSSPCGNFHNLQKQAFLSTAAALTCKQGIFLYWSVYASKHLCVWLSLYCGPFMSYLQHVNVFCACAFIRCSLGLPTLVVLSSYMFIYMMEGSMKVLLNTSVSNAGNMPTHRRLNPHLIHTPPNAAFKLNSELSISYNSSWSAALCQSGCQYQTRLGNTKRPLILKGKICSISP